MITPDIKPWYYSKTLWSAIIAIFITLYNALAPLRGWPEIPAEVYAILGALGLYGLRLANTTIGRPGEVTKAPDNVTPNAAPAPALPSAWLDAAAYPPAEPAPLPSAIQPLLGLPDLSGVGALLGSPALESVVKMALTAAGLGAGKAELLAVGYKLARLAPDLLDGNPMLSTDHLNLINGVVLDLKADFRGGLK